MIIKKTKILILLFIIIKCEKIEGNSEPINTTEYECQEFNETIELEIGNEIILCIHIPELRKKVPFKIKVDEYSLLTINQGFSFFSEKLNETHFIAQIGNITSSYPSVKNFFILFHFQLYLNKTEDNLIVPIFNIVIKINKGYITEIFWDHQCYGCDNSKCLSITSNYINSNETIEYKNCKETYEDDSDDPKNDPKFYITWFGTDKHKRQMKSSNLAISKFKQYSVKDLYESVKETIQNISYIQIIKKGLKSFVFW